MMKKPKHSGDYETEMMKGCASCLWVSLLVFALGLAPFFVGGFRVDAFQQSLIVGVILTSIVGFFASLKLGIPALCGAIGAGLAIGVFLVLLMIFVVPTTTKPGTATVVVEPGMVILYASIWILIISATGFGGFKIGARKA